MTNKHKFQDCPQNKVVEEELEKEMTHFILENP